MVPSGRKKIPAVEATSLYLRFCLTGYQKAWPTIESSLQATFGSLPSGDGLTALKNEFFFAAVSVDSHAIDNLISAQKDLLLEELARHLDNLSPGDGIPEIFLDYRLAWDNGPKLGNMPHDQVAIRLIERAHLPFRRIAFGNSVMMDSLQITMVGAALVSFCATAWWKQFSEQCSVGD